MKVGKSLGPLVISVLLGALPLRAGEPWKEKPYTEWSQKDVAKVLENSPWAQAVWIQTPPAVSTTPVWVPGAESSVGMKFLVQWISSVTIRQALLRQKSLNRESNSPDPAESPSTVDEEYMILVRWVGTGLYASSHSETAHLEFKHSKQKVKNTRTEFVLERELVVGVVFYFPREVDGKPLIQHGDGKLTFQCVMRNSGRFLPPNTIVRAEFDLRKMARDGKPDL